MMAPAARPPSTPAATPQPRQRASALVGASVAAARVALVAIARSVFLMGLSWVRRHGADRVKLSSLVPPNRRGEVDPFNLAEIGAYSDENPTHRCGQRQSSEIVLWFLALAG
jgi:hypothetical protein